MITKVSGKFSGLGALGLLVLANLAACSVDGGSGEPVERVLQAQDNFTPTGCTGSDVPGKFIEACLLNGGESVHCDNGVAWCCRACHPGEAGGCDEYCSQNPDDLSRKDTDHGEIVVVDTVKAAEDPPRRAPLPERTPDRLK